MTDAQGTLARTIAALLLAAIAVAALRLTEGEGPMIVRATFQEAGLNVRPGYEVRVRGLPVGTVRSISIDRRDFSAEYSLALDRNVAVARDTSARLVPKTLFGDKYVELDAAAPGAPRLQAGDRIGRARTVRAPEFQTVLDRLVPTLEAIDPVKFGATIAALSEGLAGQGDNLRALAEGLAPALEEVTARRDDLKRLLTAAPGVAGTIAERSADLAAAADRLGAVAGVLGEHDEALGRLLRESAELTLQTADLLGNRPARLGRIIPDALDVLGLMTETRGRVAKFASSVRYNLRGTANIMKSGWIQTRVTNTFILNVGTLYDAPGPYGDYGGGTGVTPDIYLKGLPKQNVPVDLRGSRSHGLDALMGNLGQAPPPAPDGPDAPKP